MKFAFTGDQKHFFDQNNWIQFELLSPSQIAELKEQIHLILEQRSKEAHKNNTFFLGRDLWRSNGEIKKLVLNSKLASLASGLTGKRSLRIGFDQLLPSHSNNGYCTESWSLVEKGCIQGAECGLMICLEASQEEVDPTLSPQLPRIPGQGIFFKASFPIDMTLLEKATGFLYLLIAYADLSAIYIFNDKDPNCHKMKQQGYVFGDRLSDKLNPIVHRY